MILADYLFKQYLDNDEVIEAVIHRHPIVFGRNALPILGIGFFLPVFLWYLFPEMWPLLSLWILVSGIRMVREFMIWYHDAILITNMSLIDVYWHGFFDRSSTRLEYNMMEGVTTEIRGLRRVLLNYGTVSVQRGGGTNPLVLNDAINPRRAERKIMEYQEHFLKDQQIKDSETLKALLTQMVRQHHGKTDEKPQPSAKTKNTR